jgi:hypothetical protein
VGAIAGHPVDLKSAARWSLQFQGSVGTSLRPDALGGPEFRAYLGLHWMANVF